jgi:AcrR family transcriptional regulator
LSPSPRPLRTDARKNRARLLEAAETVLAVRGPSASTEEIARAAGVGAGTLFRHFPTKEALLEAILIDRLHRLTEQARALATAPDPGAAFFSFFTRMVDQSATKKAFADALSAAGVDVKSVVSPAARDLRRAIATLLARAQKTAAVRDDVHVAEVMALLVGTARAAEHAAGDRALQSRTLTVVLDGLRPR